MQKWAHGALGLLTVALLQHVAAPAREQDASFGCRWPTCGEANASEPSYQPYHPCPSGSSEGMIDAGRLVASSSGTNASANNTDCTLDERFEITSRLHEPSLSSSTSDAVSGGQRSDTLLI